jgi:hypothetical protein
MIAGTSPRYPPQSTRDHDRIMTPRQNARFILAFAVMGLPFAVMGLFIAVMWLLSPWAKLVRPGFYGEHRG